MRFLSSKMSLTSMVFFWISLFPVRRSFVSVWVDLVMPVINVRSDFAISWICLCVMRGSQQYIKIDWMYILCVVSSMSREQSHLLPVMCFRMDIYLDAFWVVLSMWFFQIAKIGEFICLWDWYALIFEKLFKRLVR